MAVYEDPPLSSSIPEAPPLPLANPLAKTVFERLRYTVRKTPPQSSSPDAPKDATTITRKFGPTSSQSTSHRTGLNLRALDINQSRTHVVLAGGKILKTVRVNDEPSCVEDFNLRTAALNYAWDAGKPRRMTHDTTSVQRDLFDIEDVAWSNNQFCNHIATAARNGKIMLYDLTRPGVEIGSLHEHYRQVHKVDFNPLEGACLLSGSQDGTVRLWDLRSSPRSGSMETFGSRGDGVRHVKWSPRDTWSFAFGTDNGTIQRWDTRNTKIHQLKRSAHYGTCNSIDWHPDGKHLVSAGKDQVVKVWNISPETRERKAIFILRTPREVQNVRWRPPCLAVDSQDNEVKQCTHFATSYKTYPVLHVWDIRRPSLPFREINHRTNGGTTDMLWRTKDLLWSVGPDGEFSQTDVPFAPKTIDRRSLSAISCAPDGELNFVSTPRSILRIPAAEGVSKHDSFHMGQLQPQSPQRPHFGRSPGDDSFDEKFLGPSLRRRHSRTPSVKSMRLMGTTPPSAEEMAKMATADLYSTVKAYPIFKPLQSAKLGLLPGTAPSATLTYLAQKYRRPAASSAQTVRYMQSVQGMFDRNANYAQRASHYRDAQTWKILGTQISKELQNRAEHNRNARLKRLSTEGRKLETALPRATRNIRTPDTSTIETPSDADKGRALKALESSSNVPTPIVRPTKGMGSGLAKLDSTEAEADVKEIQLPPSLTAGKALGKVCGWQISGSDRKLKSDLEKIPKGVGVPDHREREPTMNQLVSQRRVPSNLDQNMLKSRNINVPLPLNRRNSSENFMIFSTSSDSQLRHLASGSFASGLSQSTGQESGVVYEKPRHNSSFQSGASARSMSGRMTSQESQIPRLVENRDSFLDLPTHGNLHVDDFVDRFSDRNSTREEGQSGTTCSVETIPTWNGTKGDIVTVDRADPGSHQALSHHRTRTDLQPDEAEHQTPRRLVTKVSTEPSQIEAFPLRRGGNVDTVKAMTQSAPSLLNRDELQGQATREYVLLDYLLPGPDVNDTPPMAIQAKEMLCELLTWYTANGDSQMASHLFLLSAPLLAPPGSFVPHNDGLETPLDASYNDYLTSSLSMPQERVSSVLKIHRTLLHTLHVSPALAEAILTTYHEQLLSLNLLNPAADIRRLSYPTFPGVYEQGLKDVDIGMLCLGCKDPINNPRNKMRCETCHQQQAECAICWCRDSPFDLPGSNKKKALTSKTSTPPPSSSDYNKPFNHPTELPTNSNASTLWTTCAICNHGTHTACSLTWFSDLSSLGSGGGCPLSGCVCDCARGFYREQRLAQVEERENQRRKSVRKDDWAVGESKAVERVKGSWRGKGSIGGGLALSENGRAPSDEGKKVRVVEPDLNGR